MGFATRTRRPPRTLTDAEVDKLLKVSGEHRDGFRDHVIFSIALGCGLRESEIVGLDVEDMRGANGRPKRMVQLRVFKRGGGKTDAEAQRVHLPDGTFYKLDKYLRMLKRSTGPLFTSRGGPGETGGARLSVRRVRSLFRTWQQRAGFDRLLPFHALRHTAVTHAYEESEDIAVAQKFARHANIQTTRIYAEPSDEAVARATRRLAS